MEAQKTLSPPAAETRHGFRLWQDRRGGVEVRFLGRGPELSRQESLARVEARAPTVAMLQQLHSTRVVTASPGSCGRGDALVTDQTALALSVITADCVPILVAGEGGRLLAIHAGWRGVASGIVGAALERLGRPAGALAWVGPAIGPCCYEVGSEVAEAVVAAAGAAALSPRNSGQRPHLDLQEAVLSQLGAAGVRHIERLDCCTRCHPDLLWSYRRDGAQAGRNMAFIWRA
jgi:polyphenol oxidase